MAMVDTDALVHDLQVLSDADYVYAKDKIPWHKGYREGIRNAIEVIREKTGRPAGSRWILHDVSCPESYECSTCHTIYVEEQNAGCDRWLFCPNCGTVKKHA